MSPDLKRLLYALNDKFGETQHSRIHRTEYISIHKSKRKGAIWCLVKTLIKRGKEQNYFETNSFQNDIMNFFFPDLSTEGLSKAKRDGARSVVLRELNEVLASIFKEEDLCDEIPSFPAPAPSRPVEIVTQEPLKLRPDVKGSHYDSDDTVIDEDFMNQLKEIANE